MEEKFYPFYYFNNRFHGRIFDNKGKSKPHYIDFTAKKVFKTNTTSIEVSRNNLFNVCRRVVIPISQVAAHTQNVKFISDITEMEPAFADIEVDSKSLDFILGYINEKKFTDSEKFSKALKEHPLLIMFNGFKFDLRLMREKHPEHFFYTRVSNFVIPIVPSALVVDMLVMYKLWYPWQKFHSLSNLAEQIGFDEERLSYDAEPSLKCEQDIRVMKQAYPLFVPQVFRAVSGLVDMDRYLQQVLFFDRLRRLIFVDHLLTRYNFLPTSFPRVKEVEKWKKPVLLAKPGIYKNIAYWDVSSAYPRVASQHEFSIYLPEDFTSLQKKYVEMRVRHHKISQMIKFLQNASIGDTADRNNKMRNPEIRDKIVGILAKEMKSIITKDTIYANTDCVAQPSKLPPPKIPGYDILEKYQFDFFAVFTVNRWIGKDLLSNTIKKRGFQRRFRIKGFYDMLDGMVERELIRGNLKVLKYPEKLIKIINWETLDKELLAIKILKTTEEVRNVAYIEIWHRLEMNAFNNIYLGSKGFVLKKPNIRRYQKEAKIYLRQYKIKS